MDKNIGKKLDGRYEITELIGVGGMADVYKATDIVDNKIVAVKILKKEFAENEEFLRRFRNESKAIALLSHPNIVKVYDVGFSDKIQFIVMEYIDGITLKEYIENEKVLTWKDSVHFIIQILRALQHAHDRGIVHRDIKPQNIMLFTDGTIKVMDFGIAKFAREEGRTATDQAIGTVHYISPEQARGDVTDEKSDIYSVGVMLYEMLTGQKPFDTDNPVTVAVMHMQNTPERPRAINPDIPAGLEEVILRAMEKDAENRYQTASDMIRDIESFKANTSMTFGYYVEDVDDDAAYDEEDDDAMYAGAAAATAVTEFDDDDDYEYDDDDDSDDYYDDEDDEEEEEESHSLFIPVMTAVTIAFIVVAVIFVVWLIQGVLNGEGIKTTKYEMPDLVGMDYYEAKDQYTYLDIQINETKNSAYEKDIIYEQDITVGDAISEGEIVYVNVSLGVSEVKIPEVATFNYEYAAKILEQEGFVPDIKYEVSTEGIEAYAVIRTEPAAGEMAPSGSIVTIWVSKGVNAEDVEMPDLIGQTLESATAMCEYYGLVVETVDEASVEDENTVIDQSIEPGELISAGDTITLTYSNGEDPSGTVPFTLSLPENATGRFVLDFIDANGVTLTSSSTINAAFSGVVTVNVEGTGTQRVTVILSNYATNQQATLGVYNFDFVNVTFTRVTEDILAAFQGVGGIAEETTTTEAPTTEAPTTQPPTQPTTPPPTEPPTDPTTPAPTDPPTDPTTQAPTDPPATDAPAE
ncbi:MAG: Stk1 family PASTA domain-containing Ser/Thr kinase [Oscillospiraceae bacterium]|nr:Stk1 family PASTA domain-containing Ser/Thr kinase [Oscillospiraceae bacterium]